MGTRQANLTSSDRPVELVYKGIKQEIEELRATAIEWTNDLKRLIPDKGGEGMTDTISILVIEGEPNLRRELTSALTEAGFVVADVPDILKANEIREFNPNIAIVDEVLPSGDGKDACSQLHNAFGIPVILLGKDSSGEAWMRAVEAGADFYFTKPSHHQELIARVKVYCGAIKKLRHKGASKL